jgi:hypothetical protein
MPGAPDIESPVVNESDPLSNNESDERIDTDPLDPTILDPPDIIVDPPVPSADDPP